MFDALMKERSEKIQAFIDKDLSLAERLQAQVERKLLDIENADQVDIHQLRQVALTYKESRLWMQEILTIVDILNKEGNDENS